MINEKKEGIMRYRMSIILLITVSVLASCALIAYAQENQPVSQTQQTVAPAPAPEPKKDDAAKELSLYGEVQAVNTAAHSLSVQYYDYDTDEERLADIGADKDTKIENAATLADIKKGDWVDVTYAAKDNKNIAKVIAVEKEEAPAAPESAAPADDAADTGDEY